MKKTFSITIITLLVLVDQLLKIIIDLWLRPIHHYVLADHVLSLTYVENRGAAFGMLQNQRWFFIILTLAVVGIGIYYILANKVKSDYLLVCFLLIIAGGVGNLIDRIFRGYVIDYIEFLFVRFAVFNFADILVTLGAVLLIGWLLFHGTEDKKAGKLEIELQSAEDKEYCE